MRDPLHRLYTTKLTLIATLFTVTGLALIVLARWAAGEPWWTWLTRLPVLDLGSALFTTGLVAVVFSYFDGQDSEERATERLKRVIGDSAPDIRDAVIDGFSFKRDDLARVATPELLDQIIATSLALRLADEEFASDIYTDIRDQAIRATERWHDVRVMVKLSKALESGAGEARSAMFMATITWEYTTTPATQMRRFACVSNRVQYRELSEDPTTSVWYVSPRHGVDPLSEEAFELVQYCVDGQERPIRRSARGGGQTYTVNLGHDLVESASPVTISYTYRTVVPVRGNLLHLSLEQPTKGLDIDVDYSDCGIERMSVVDFIASSQRIRVNQSPASLPEQTVRVGFDGWAMPGAGVALVWSLYSE